MGFRHDPNTLWPTLLVDWHVILMLAAALVALLWPGPGYVRTLAALRIDATRAWMGQGKAGQIAAR
jgi:hypothetical protein